jgi:hypothetical protein
MFEEHKIRLRRRKRRKKERKKERLTVHTDFQSLFLLTKNLMPLPSR